MIQGLENLETKHKVKLTVTIGALCYITRVQISLTFRM